MTKQIYDDAFLITKSLIKDLSKKERHRLEQLLKNHSLQEIHKELSDRHYLKKQFTEYEKYSPEKAFGEFKKKRGWFAEEIKQIKKRRQIRRWMAWSAVAAGIACLVSVALLPEPAWKTEPSAVAVQNEVVVPGSTKATLRLAGKETIRITGDSMQIAGKEKSHIRYADGKLTYAAKEKAAELVYNELEVPVTGEFNVVLDDGTQVWVNAASRLKYPVQFMGKERKVFLEGEAYFVVAKDSVPFVVSTSRGDIRVLGTTFNVKAYEEEVAMQTTLVEGKVLVAQGEKEIELAPGEQGTVTVNGEMEKRKVDVEEFVGWRTGVYVFRKQALGDIMRDLSRWYGVSVFFQNEDLKQVCFTGNLKRYDTINEFLNVLQRTGDIRYRTNNNTVIIYE